MTYLTPSALADRLEASLDLYYGLDEGFGSAVLFDKRYGAVFERDEQVWTLAEEPPYALVEQYCESTDTGDQFAYMQALTTELATRAFQRSVLVQRIAAAPTAQHALAVLFETTASDLAARNVRAGYLGLPHRMPEHLEGMTEFNYSNDFCVFYELARTGKDFTITARVDSTVRAVLLSQPEFAKVAAFFTGRELDITVLVGQILRQQDEIEAAQTDRTYAGLAEFAERWLSTQVERLQSALSATHIPTR